MKRIAVLGLQHETNSFVPGRTEWEDFLAPGGWPPMSRGAEVPANLAGTGVATAGALAEAARHADVAAVPVFWSLALPGPPVSDAAFARLTDEIAAGLRAALDDGPLDGVFAEMHGAMATESDDDPEASLAAAIRAVVGPHVPLALACDLHGNVSDRFVEAATLVEAYRTYPHVDMKRTGERAMARLLALLAGAPAPSFAVARPPFQVALTWQCTLSGPGARVAQEAERLMAADPALAIAQFLGFPLADVPDAGPAILAQHPDPAAAGAAAGRLDALWRSLEAQFDGPIPDAADAVAEAMRVASGPGTGPVVVADTQDNPGGGGPGDTTGLLSALLAARAEGAVLVHVADAEAAAAAHAAGVGATIDVAVGGRALPETGAPVPGPWRVEALAAGPFTGEGPMYRGARIDLGRLARLSQDGVHVIVAEKRMQASEPALPRRLGIEPADARILCVKSSVHFRGAYQDMARAVIVARAPGPVTADLCELPARRQTRPPAGRSSRPRAADTSRRSHAADTMEENG